MPQDGVGQVMVSTFTNEMKIHSASVFILKTEPNAALENGVTHEKAQPKFTVVLGKRVT